MCCSICAAKTGVARHSHVSTDRWVATLLVRVGVNVQDPHVVRSSKHASNQDVVKDKQDKSYVAIGSGQGHARLNGGRRESIGCSRLHLQTARHWAFGHAKFRGRANQENGKTTTRHVSL